VEKMIGYCGYNCHVCAARSDDPEVRQKLVDGWRKIYGHEHYTAEMTREEYELCVPQFDSFPNIVRALVDAGRLPEWVRKDEG